MDIRFENRDRFYVSGYSMETSEATLEQDCAMMREKYEDRLKSISDHLYFVAYMEKEVMIYLFCARTASLTPATEGAICKEIPATRCAVATVPKGTSILATWYAFFDAFEKELPVLGGATIDLDYPFHIEAFDKNGGCELWIPVK
ncbi:MAG: GyrI-like domain-containing protein [Oscillospiraceae bacterium]|nr:GyrI-like domain-containing protein [Oscillospiraceae bacterium]